MYTFVSAPTSSILFNIQLVRDCSHYLIMFGAQRIILFDIKIEDSVSSYMII